MKDWIISIAIIVTLVSVISLIIPKGKTNSIINCVFSLIITLTIISPIINYLCTLSNVELNVEDTKLNMELNSLIYGNKIYIIENNCKKIINDFDIGCEVSVDYIIKSNELIIKKVNIFIENEVIKSDKVNINILGQIKEIISSYLDIDINKVKINE